MEEIVEKEEFTPFVYVDGSYDVNTKIFGAGYIMQIKEDANPIVYKEAHNGKDKKWKSWAKMRNVAGEVTASMRAIEKAISEGVKELKIYYDYTGIAAWAKKEWQAKNKCTQYYVQFIDDNIKKIDITFVKVKSHSGVEFNDIADKLAKDAVSEEADRLKKKDEKED